MTEPSDDKMTFARYEALAHLVKYGNLYQLRVIERGRGVEETHDWWRAVDPDDPQGYRKMVGAEDVRWLVERGYAEASPDFDWMFARGKVLPTDAGRARLQDPGLTRESDGVAVHLSHCCLEVHGCKYGNEFCPVETRLLPPDSPRCGACYEDDMYRDDELNSYSDRDLIEELEHRGYLVGPENTVWVLMGGSLDSDQDPFNPEGRCPPGPGGIVAVFRTRDELVEHVESNPVHFEDQMEPLAWREWRTDLTWWCGPLTHGRGYQWLSGLPMKARD